MAACHRREGCSKHRAASHTILLERAKLYSSVSEVVNVAFVKQLVCKVRHSALAHEYSTCGRKRIDGQTAPVRLATHKALASRAWDRTKATGSRPGLANRKIRCIVQITASSVAVLLRVCLVSAHKWLPHWTHVDSLPLTGVERGNHLQG